MTSELTTRYRFIVFVTYLQGWSECNTPNYDEVPDFATHAEAEAAAIQWIKDDVEFFNASSDLYAFKVEPVMQLAEDYTTEERHPLHDELDTITKGIREAKAQGVKHMRFTKLDDIVFELRFERFIHDHMRDVKKEVGLPFSYTHDRGDKSLSVHLTERD